MKYLMIEGVKGLGEPITVNGVWLVKIDEPRGVLPCPFEDKMNYKKTALVKNLKNNEEFFLQRPVDSPDRKASLFSRVRKQLQAGA